MALTKTLLKFRKLITSNKLPKAFTDEIRSESDLFLSKPVGSSADFSAAFHSRKTSSAVRYALAVSGLLGEQNVLDRSLASLNKKLHFKVEPQYTKKGGRLKLSHFVVKGFDSSGHGQYLKIDNVSKQMMMGTPVDAPRVRYATAAISGKGRKAPKIKTPKAKPPIKVETQELINEELINQPLDISSFKNMVGKFVMTKDVERRDLMNIKQTIDRLREESPLLLTSEEVKMEVAMSRIMLSTKDQLAGVEGWEEAEKSYEMYLDVMKQMPEVNKMYAATKLGWRPSTPLIDSWVKPRKPRAKPTTRKLRARERARINTAVSHILQHLQGIMWVLHCTIKLNDKRRQFMYVDEDYVWRPESSEPVTLNLHGFPNHINHYIEQHKKYNEWFAVLRVITEAEELRERMNSAYRVAKDIDGDFFGDEEDMQDFVDELLGLCSAALRSATVLYDKIINADWIFSERVPYDFKLPPNIPRFVRHQSYNQAFKPTRDREAMSLKVGRYKALHSDYWSKMKND